MYLNERILGRHQTNKAIGKKIDKQRTFNVHQKNENFSMYYSFRFR